MGYDFLFNERSSKKSFVLAFWLIKISVAKFSACGKMENFYCSSHLGQFSLVSCYRLVLLQ